MRSVLPLVLLISVLGITQVVRANLLEELESVPAAQASAGNQAPPAGSPAPPAELNTGEGLKSSSDVPVASGSFPQGGCNSNGPLLNLAPGSYIQFKVAVPPGFLARVDDTPDGGKVISVISPEPACPKCGVGRAIDGSPALSVNSIENPAPQGAGNVRMNVQNYQESAQMVQRAASPPQQNYPQQYSAPEQSMSSSQMYMKNSGYRKVQMAGANQLPYPQQRGGQMFPPPPPPPQQSFQRSVAPPPPPPPPPPQMTQRLVRPPQQYQPMASAQQYQQPQYVQMNSAPEYAPQQQQQPPQYVQQGVETNAYQQQPQFQPPPTSQQPEQPSGSLQKFHTALRSLDEGAEQQ